MNPLTLTHRQLPYLAALAILLTLGSSSLAQKLRDGVRQCRGFPIIGIHLVILSVAAAAAVHLWGVPRLFPDSAGSFAILLSLGLIVGGIAIWADRSILRAMSIGKVREPVRISLGALAIASIVGLLEEVLFRGYLVDLSRAIQSQTVGWIAVVLTALAFAISHAFAGPAHVIAKLPLSFLALASVLVSNTLLVAIVAHVFFNLRSTDASLLDHPGHYNRRGFSL